MPYSRGEISDEFISADTLPSDPPDGMAGSIGYDDTMASTSVDDTDNSRSSSSGSSVTRGRKPVASVEGIELAQNWARLRMGTKFGSVAWFAFGSLDYVVARWLHPGSLATIWTLRLIVGLLVIIPALVFIRRTKTPSQRRLLVLDYLLFQSATWSVALMTLWTGGISSIYYGGIALIMVIRTAIFADPWRKGILPNLCMVLPFPLVNVLHALVDADALAQFSNSAAVAAFVINCSLLVAIGTFIVIAGDSLWRARRLVYESRSIGRYRLNKRIGKGGMGEVWSAWHRGLKRDVALKLLTQRVGNSNWERRFEREVAATVRLQHPNTIRILDHGVSEDGIRFYAMELLEGEDLAAMVATRGPLAVSQSCYLLKQVANSLAEAHDKSIYHRDIKPENIFVTNDGRYRDFVKVLDFGIAMMSDTGTDSQTELTKTGSTLGTPNYLSPEVAAGDKADARSDVYALGAVLFFSLTGQPPFVGRTVVELLHAHIGSPPPSVRAERGDEVPEALDALIRKALSKKPDDRYQNAAELAAALDAIAVTPPWSPALL